MDVMDIASLSMRQAQTNVLQSVDLKLMSNAIEQMNETGAELTKMMEASVNPGLGQSIDIRL